MVKFEWDLEKAVANARKHGVTFEEAATIFLDPLSATAHDPGHSQVEDRYITIGSTDEGRLLAVAHCDRVDRIRIISARPLTGREQKIYENE